ncbi:MAG: hypothetical protein RL596_1498 [Bacteroidota bacterium]|jgi:hypothetical protein
MKKALSKEEQKELLAILKLRFTKYMHRHKGIKWEDVEAKLVKQPAKLWSLSQMEATGGEPDIIGYDKKSDSYTFCDCAAETPKERRSCCYDEVALHTRKENKPKHSAMAMAVAMGIEMLNEEQYHHLQSIDTFDTKTSSWIQTPDNIRKLGGAIFGDFRFGRVFIYHNGAESYYAGRGFRGILKV